MRHRLNPGDETIRALHRRVAQGDLGAVGALAVALERAGRGEPFRVWVARAFGGYNDNDANDIFVTRDGAAAKIIEWIDSDLKLGHYYDDAESLIRSALSSGRIDEIIDSHNSIVQGDFNGWDGDRVYLEIEEKVVGP